MSFGAVRHLRLDRPEPVDESKDTAHEPPGRPQQERRPEGSQDEPFKHDPTEALQFPEETDPSGLARPKRDRREPQSTACCHNQTDVIVAPQDARRRRAQVVLELLQEPERPADVPCWRICEMTRHRAGNLGQIALLDKALPQVGWGSLPCDRAAGTLPTALCPCRRSSSAMPSAACA
jgi:hypothetical protein